MFAAALRESEARERAQRERERAEQEHAAALESARRDVERSVEAIRAAKRSGTSSATADAAWRAAKARLIELETGTAPTWAPPRTATELGEDLLAHSGTDSEHDHDSGDGSESDTAVDAGS